MARAVRARDVSPVELVEDALRRAEAWQPATNAFSRLHPEQALDEARHRAGSLARRDPIGPLHGVPVAVKDLFDVAGWETTGCCAAYRGRIASGDADAVRRLRRAGAVIIGKTNQHELAAGATNVVSACGRTGNPWDPARITGGSSGGSGAAVAAGVVPVALGTDTGGSVRIPASLCGVTGLKTTHGRLSLDGVMPLAPSLDTVGPLAATAEDAGLVDSVLWGGDPQPAPSLEELTVGELGSEYVAFLHPDVQELVGRAVATFRDLGARTVAVIGAPFDPALWEIVGWGEFARHHGRLLEEPGSVHPRTAQFLERGMGVGDDALVEARSAVEAVGKGFDRALVAADVLVAAATPFAAPKAGEDAVDIGGGTLSVGAGAVSLLTRTVNLAGLPAVAVPVGSTSTGLPVGMQMIGRRGSEGVLLALAERFQAATDHHLAEPPPPPEDQVLGGPPG
jgi:Asp-tRNA(Asn)/Glu-tRNA(Gln) amidotransferase A subunit family amidase